MYASLLGLSITVEMLLKRGANPQLTDSSDHTGMYGHKLELGQGKNQAKQG